MEPAVRAPYDAARRTDSNKFQAVCYAPFVSMFFNTTGNVVACCKSHSLSLGNVTTERLDAIWNGPRIAAFRKMVKAYVLPTECGFCSWQIASGDYAGVFTRHFDHYAADDSRELWPRVMEFAISNECNLECVMCSGEWSSRIRARREHLPPVPHVYGEEFFADLRKYLPHLHRAKFLGGEPFLIESNFRIWDMMIEGGLTTPCNVTTNGTQWNARVERVLDKLPVSILVSMDGATKKTLESIRVGTNFEELTANVHRFVDYTRARGTTFEFIYSLMRMNWREFPDFLRMAESLGVRADTSTVVYPPQYSLFTLPPGELLAIADELEKRDGEMRKHLKVNLATWRGTVDNLRKNATDAQSSAASHITQDTAPEATFGGVENPDSYARATALERDGRREEAITAALLTTKRDAGYYRALTLAGRLLRDSGRVEESETQLERAIAAAPARVDAYIERGWLRHRQMRTAEGLADVEHAHKLLGASPSPDTEHSLCALAGILLVTSGRPEEARVAVDRLFELRPDDPLSYMRRGWVWHAAGRPDEALADALAALARDPRMAHAADLERAARQALQWQTTSEADAGEPTAPAAAPPTAPVTAPPPAAALPQNVRNRYLALHEFARGEVVPHSLPTILQLAMNNVCNFKCVYCSDHRVGNTIPRSRLDGATWESLLHLLPNMSELAFHGISEFFVDKSFFDVVERCAKAGAALSLNTNGSVATDKHVAVLASYPGRIDVNFSLDAASAPVFTRIRGFDFERVIRNIKAYVAAFAPRRATTMLSTSFVICRSNVEEMVPFVRLSKELGVDEVKFYRLHEYGSLAWNITAPDGTPFDYRDECTDHFKEVHDRNVKAAIAEAERLGIRVSIPALYDEPAPIAGNA